MGSRIHVVALPAHYPQKTLNTMYINNTSVTLSIFEISVFNELGPDDSLQMYTADGNGNIQEYLMINQTIPEGAILVNKDIVWLPPGYRIIFRNEFNGGYYLTISANLHG